MSKQTDLINIPDAITVDGSGIVNLDSTFSSGTTGGIIRLKDAGTQFGDLNEDSGNFLIASAQVDKDIIFKGNDGGSVITAMTIDMSAGGNVGIGTSSPQHDLVVQNDDGPIISLIGHNYSDSMGIVFNGGDQTNASTSGNTGAKIMSQLSISGGAVLGDLTFTTNSGDTFVDAMNIDTSGRVTTPSQPSFRATSGASNTVSAALVFTQKDFDVSNSYSTSTGRFTAPLAGTYLFYITALYTTGSTSPTWKVGWEKNGSFDAVVGEYQSTFNSTSSYHTIFNSTITMSLASGDYVNIKNMTNQGVHISGTQTKFGGYLLG
jgi:hypothetical protein